MSTTTFTLTIDHTRDDLRRADNTAGTCIIAIAGLAALVGQIGKDLTLDVRIVTSLAALPAAATLALALAVLWPRRPILGHGVPGSWVHAAHSPSWRTLRDDYENTDLVEADARQLWLLARIAENKFTWVRRATMLLGATVAVLAAAFVYAAIRALITIIF